MCSTICCIKWGCTFLQSHSLTQSLISESLFLPSHYNRKHLHLPGMGQWATLIWLRENFYSRIRVTQKVYELQDMQEEWSCCLVLASFNMYAVVECHWVRVEGQLVGWFQPTSHWPEWDLHKPKTQTLP